MAGFEIIEHTADVGILAAGADLKETFEQTALGLLEIVGVFDPGVGDPIEIELEANDPGALLVDWLNELLFIIDARDRLFNAVHIDSIDEHHLNAHVETSPRGDEPTGTAVKAATYHQLEVVRQRGGWRARVYLDV